MLIIKLPFINILYIQQKVDQCTSHSNWLALGKFVWEIAGQNHAFSNFFNIDSGIHWPHWVCKGCFYYTHVSGLLFLFSLQIIKLWWIQDSKFNWMMIKYSYRNTTLLYPLMFYFCFQPPSQPFWQWKYSYELDIWTGIMIAESDHIKLLEYDIFH